MQLLFDAMSQMTGGIINDLTTAMLAMITLYAMFCGFELLVEVLGEKIYNSDSATESRYSKYEKSRLQRDTMRKRYDDTYNIPWIEPLAESGPTLSKPYKSKGTDQRIFAKGI